MKLKALALVLGLACGGLQAQAIDVRDAWVRSTVPGQTATAAFMRITARDGARLLEVSSPVAGVAQIHEMKMEGGVMSMRALSGGLDLPAGKTVQLQPGSYHLMLQDLKTALPRGGTVALTLVFRDGKGAQQTLALKLPVTTAAPAGQAAMETHQH